MKPKLFIVTGNTMKFKELSSKLNDFFDCEQKNWDEPEIQGTPTEIINHKLKSAYAKFKHPVLVDDTSLHFSELNGFPGPYIKDFWKCFTPYEAGMKFIDSKVKVTAWLGLCRGSEDTLIAEGTIHGKVVKPQREDHQGRWFDLFVQVDGTDKPMIEFTHEEKNQFTHRGLAMDNLIEILNKETK